MLTNHLTCLWNCRDQIVNEGATSDHEGILSPETKRTDGGKTGDHSARHLGRPAA